MRSRGHLAIIIVKPNRTKQETLVRVRNHHTVFLGTEYVTMTEATIRRKVNCCGGSRHACTTTV